MSKLLREVKKAYLNLDGNKWSNNITLFNKKIETLLKNYYEFRKYRI